MKNMKKIICPECQRKLCLTSGDIEIKCNRCKTTVWYNAETGEMKSSKEKIRTSSSGVTFS